MEENSNTGQFERKVGVFLSRPYVKLLEVISFFAATIGIIFTSIQFFQSYEDRSEQNKLITQENIARAWQTLSTPSPGNIGKKWALEILHFYGQQLEGVDLSCTRMFENRIEAEECFPGTIAQSMNLSGGILNRINLSGATLYASNFSNSAMVDSNFSHADVSLVNFSKSNLFNANFNSSRMYGAVFFNSNISRADFTNAIHIDKVNFDEAWAWSDFPPIGLPESIQVQLCDPGKEEQYRGRTSWEVSNNIKLISGPKPTECIQELSGE